VTGRSPGPARSISLSTVNFLVTAPCGGLRLSHGQRGEAGWTAGWTRPRRLQLGELPSVRVHRTASGRRGGWVPGSGPGGAARAWPRGSPSLAPAMSPLPGQARSPGRFCACRRPGNERPLRSPGLWRQEAQAPDPPTASELPGQVCCLYRVPAPCFVAVGFGASCTELQLLLVYVLI
jgi:hypothetical protein